MCRTRVRAPRAFSFKRPSRARVEPRPARNREIDPPPRATSRCLQIWRVPSSGTLVAETASAAPGAFAALRAFVLAFFAALRAFVLAFFAALRASLDAEPVAGGIFPSSQARRDSIRNRFRNRFDSI